MPFEPKCPHGFEFSWPQLTRGQLCSLVFFLKYFHSKGALQQQRARNCNRAHLPPHTHPTDLVLCSPGLLTPPCTQPFQGTPRGALASQPWGGLWNQALWSRACCVNKFSRWLCTILSITVAPDHTSPQKGSREAPGRAHRV